MDIKFISIGGWCGTKIALNFNGYLNTNYPFDYVRTSIIGITPTEKKNITKTY